MWFGVDDIFFQYKIVGVEQQIQVDVVVGDGVDWCVGIDVCQMFMQFFCFVCDVGFSQQNMVGVVNLGLGDGELVYLFIGMYCIYQCNYVVQQVMLV